jgi:hypothetical protein
LLVKPLQQVLLRCPDGGHDVTEAHILGDALTAHRVTMDFDLMLNVPDGGIRIHLGSMPRLFRYKRPPAR